MSTETLFFLPLRLRLSAVECRRLPSSNRSDYQKLFLALRDDAGKRRVQRIVGQVLLAGEEANEGTPLACGIIAQRTAERWIADLERVEHAPYGDGTLNFELHLRAALSQRAEMRR